MPSTKGKINFENHITSISDFLYNNLKEYVTTRQNLSILYIGVSYQDQILYPLLEKVKDTNPNIEFDIDIKLNSRSIETNASNNNVFFGTGFEIANNSFLQNNRNLIEQIKNIKSYLKAPEKHNIENNLINLSNLKIDKKYDLVFALFENHFEINWKEGLMNLVDIIAEEGNCIYADLSGDIEILDGNFQNNDSFTIENNLVELLHKFDQERYKEHFWRPEISVTNYKSFSHHLNYFFSSIIGYDENRKSKENVFDLKFEITIENLIYVMEHNQCSFFKNGLSNESKSKAQLKNMLGKLVDGNKVFEFNYNLNLFIGNKRNNKASGDIESNYWNFNSLFKNLHDIQSESVDELMNRSLDLFVTHGILIASLTKFLSIIEYPDIEVKDMHFPIHYIIDFNTNQKNEVKNIDHIIERNMRNFILEEIHLKNSLLKTMFQKQNYKANWYFLNVHNFEKYADLKKNKLKIIKNDKIEEIYLSYKKDKNGKVKDITVVFEFAKNDSLLEYQNMTDISKREFKFEEFKKNSYKENTKKNEIQKYVEHVSENINLLEKLGVTLNDFNICIDLIFKYLNDKNPYKLIFYPSIIIEQVSEKNSTPFFKGLGGTILSESTINISNVY